MLTHWKNYKILFIWLFTYIKLLFLFSQDYEEWKRTKATSHMGNILKHQQTQKELFHLVRRPSYVTSVKEKNCGVWRWLGEKIAICLLKALLGWLTLDVPSITCREHKLLTYMVISIMCLFLPSALIMVPKMFCRLVFSFSIFAEVDHSLFTTETFEASWWWFHHC